MIQDDEVTGFGLRVKPSGKMPFPIQCRSKQSKSKRFTLGPCAVLTPDQAREKAKETIAAMLPQGLDLARQHKDDRSALSVKDLCEDNLREAGAGNILGRRDNPKRLSTLTIDKVRMSRHILPRLGKKVSPLDVAISSGADVSSQAVPPGHSMTSASLPCVSILLPAYQAAEFIQPTLDSISAQTWKDFEAIVSVDVCSDSTYEICLAHAARDNRFKVVKQESRQGYVGNCNALLGLAQGEFALFAFHDDVLAPSYLEKLSTALRDAPKATMSYSDLELTRTDGNKEHWTFSALQDVSSRTERGLRMLARTRGWWVPNRGMFRMSAARKVQGLKTHAAGEFSTDWPWLFHLSLTGEFVRVAETLCFKYYKPGSLSRSWEFSGVQWFEVTVSCMREVWASELSSEEKLKLARPLMAWLEKNRPRHNLANPK